MDYETGKLMEKFNTNLTYIEAKLDHLIAKLAPIENKETKEEVPVEKKA